MGEKKWTEETASQNPTARERIQTPFARIIVSGTEKKPYYNIMYFDRGEMHIGFSSYKLELVQKWLREEFDVRQNDDVVPVVRCRDCQWFAGNNYGVWYGCQMFNVLRDAPEDAPRPNDFCSFGERKEEADDVHQD